MTNTCPDSNSPNVTVAAFALTYRRGADDVPSVVRPAPGRMEGVMRRMSVVAAIALLGFAASALAEGTIVRWNAIVGLSGHEADSPNLVVGDMVPVVNWHWVEGGKAQLNLATGQVQIQIQHVSWAVHGAGINRNPIGNLLGGYPDFPRTGTFVCDSVGKYGGPISVHTELVYLDANGSLKHHGRVDVPTLCRDYPDQIAFVFGSAGTRYFAFGAAQQVLNSDKD
jgi:hypothetical protein